MPGPVIQDDLVSITLRFRMFRYAFVFVQILLFTPDCCFQEILCRTFPSEPVRIFQLSTDTYGTSCVPYFATIYSKKLAKFGETILLQVARIISKDFMWISTSQTRSYRLARRKNNIEAIILYSKQNAGWNGRQQPTKTSPRKIFKNDKSLSPFKPFHRALCVLFGRRTSL